MQSTLAGGPRSKREPEDGEQLKSGSGSKLSVAEKVTAVPNGDVASTVLSPCSDGGVKSTVHVQGAGSLGGETPSSACTENK
jgi:hypothetical protein